MVTTQLMTVVVLECGENALQVLEQLAGRLIGESWRFDRYMQLLTHLGLPLEWAQAVFREREAADPKTSGKSSSSSWVISYCTAEASSSAARLMSTR